MLAGKQIVVTGANGALGQALVAQALGKGARLVAVDREFTQKNTDVEQITVDLTDSDATHAALDKLGTVDALCNIAGGFSMGPDTHALDNQEWVHLFAMNVTTMRNVNAAIVPKMLASSVT